MINKDAKAFCSIFCFFFVFTEITVLMYGEGIMFGFRVFDEIQLFAGVGIIVTIFAMILIFKDKIVGYPVLVSIMGITLVYFGHNLNLWPCRYCEL